MLRVQKVLNQLNPTPKKCTVLVYGDSCTWCFAPTSSMTEYERLDESQRWPIILEKKLNSTNKHNKLYTVIAEGLNGRTIKEDQFLEFGTDKVNMNGYKQFLPIVHSHKPIDIIIFMLGVNNTKKEFNPTAQSIAKQMKQLLELAINSDDLWADLSNKTVIFIAQASVNNINKVNSDWDFDENSIKISRDLGKEYKKILDELKSNCDSSTTIKLLDAPKCGVVTGVDSVHLDGKNNAKLANAVYDIL